ncbi:MAG: thymidine phosphorylase [Bacilli bacterium]|nr:thymidine phosphorylase [Bacilli bacterium]
MNIIEIINKKRLKQELSKEELVYVINGFLTNEIKDYQMSSLLMAICINGMTEAETINLTLTMLDNSDILDLNQIDGIKVDKHSTGGVGDKTTLVVVPLVASCGVKVAKMSGRGLGHTGGTIDKLEAIKGFNVNLSNEEFIKQVQRIGAVITTTSHNLVPADKKIYALRDVTGTVSSIPLIAASIMSKKIATGADKIVLDVKVGKGALINNKEEAQVLANLMIKIGNYFKKEVVVVISNMDYPLGNNIGNGLEIEETINILKGNIDTDLGELCIALATEMVSLGKSITLEEAKQLVINNLHSGCAFDKFKEMVTYQNGDIDDINIASQVIEIRSNNKGYITNIDALTLGKVCVDLGAGRKQKEDDIDYGVGIVLTKKINDYVQIDDVIAKVYVNKLGIDLKKILSAFTIELQPIKKEPLILAVLRKNMF